MTFEGTLNLGLKVMREEDWQRIIRQNALLMTLCPLRRGMLLLVCLLATAGLPKVKRLKKNKHFDLRNAHGP